MGWLDASNETTSGPLRESWPVRKPIAAGLDRQHYSAFGAPRTLPLAPAPTPCPLSVMLAASRAGRQTIAVVFAGMVTSRLKRPSSTFHALAMRPRMES